VIDLDDVFAPFRELDRSRSFVVAQLGQSLDGRIATLSGESQWINGSCALDHVHRIRAAVDAVIVGVGTVLADDPRLTVRRASGAHPARVVIDPSGRMPPSCQCMNNDGVRRIVVRTRSASGRSLPVGVEEIVLPDNDGIVSPRDIVASLFETGLSSILIEGGARTISSFIEAGCVDRLHILVAPVILGSGKPGLELAPIASLNQALRPATRIFPLPDNDVLFDCDLRSGAPPES
jgi:riboflavin-specific deaminase-like protein